MVVLLYLVSSEQTSGKNALIYDIVKLCVYFTHTCMRMWKYRTKFI
jgi:hypothetical protein